MFLWERTKCNVHGDGFIPSDRDVVRYNLANRGYASNAQVFQLPFTLDQEHGIVQSNAS